MKHKLNALLLASAFAAFSMVSGACHAQAYPTKPIRLVVPFAAGGSADVMGRAIAVELSKLYSQSVIVENRGGAGGNLGAEAVAKSTPDGYTLLFGTIGIHAAYKIYPKLGYDPAKDLQAVNLLAELPNILIVYPGFAAQTLKEYMAIASQQPGTIFFGSAGNGSSTHMAGELFKQVSKLDIKHVPYKGSSMALTDVVGGQIQSMFENLPTAVAMVRSGKVRALGVTSRERAPSLPNVPTLIEAGLPGYEFTAWFTIAAPRGVPAAIVGKLNADINTIMHSALLAPKWAEQGVTPMRGDPASAEAFFAAETKKWTAVIESQHLRVD
jgi:tripartite-type tricarboxylate transporter receptor subunit TctC